MSNKPSVPPPPSSFQQSSQESKLLDDLYFGHLPPTDFQAQPPNGFIGGRMPLTQPPIQFDPNFGGRLPVTMPKQILQEQEQQEQK
jgi:hypothetical protein